LLLCIEFKVPIGAQNDNIFQVFYIVFLSHVFCNISLVIVKVIIFSFLLFYVYNKNLLLLIKLFINNFLILYNF